MIHPLKPGTTISYDGRRQGCKKPKQIREGQVKKVQEVDGKYWYLLNNGKLCHQDKITG